MHDRNSRNMYRINLPRALAALAFCCAPFMADAAFAEAQCTYSTYKWNVNIRRAVEPRMVEKIIAELQRQHAPLKDVVGYRVGMTRGNPDKHGNRTGFSNHSFGVALDINTDHNGLYENCFKVSSACRLIKGGRWDPKQEESLTADSLIVRTFKQNGFKWGGEIAGQQKDFMHFSPTGY